MFNNAPKGTIDFETKSGISIRDVGNWRYAEDETTRVLCMAWKVPGMPDADLWHPAFPHLGILEAPPPIPLFEWIADGGLVEAHNSAMERSVWRRIMMVHFGWEDIPDPQWRCSAAKAARFALPRALEDLAQVLKVPEQKDMDGSKLMKRLTRPRKPRKAEVAAWVRDHGAEPMPLFWQESKAEYERLFEYCRQDVRAEECCSDYLPDLSPLETEIFLADQRINERGVYIDMGAVDAALNIVSRMTGGMTKELPALTCPLMESCIDGGMSLKDALVEVARVYDEPDDPPPGAVLKATQRAKVLSWINQRGVPLLDTQGTTVDEVLKREDMPQDAYRVLTILRAVNRTSTAKYVSMRDRVSWDSRVRGSLIYHGASTGRWTGSGIQPHNLPRGSIVDMDEAWDDVLEADEGGDLRWLEFLHGDPMEHLSHCTRGAIASAPGKVLYVADYSAVESRVLFWLADQQNALDIFRRHDDIYCYLASQIYRKDINAENKNDYKVERQLGKQAILGLGYGMGADKFVATCAKYGIVITKDFAVEVVAIYRETYGRVKQMWYDQEAAAIQAVRSPGMTFTCGRIQWRVFRAGPDGRGLPFLHCKLPSGRTLAYCDPKIIDKETPWGAMKPALTFMGVNPLTRQWTRQHTYGGSIVENIVQATARDLLAEAMLRAEATGVYWIVLHVHDELVAEVDEDKGDVHEFERLMSVNPEWAEGCPVDAESPKVHGKPAPLRRYKK